MGVELRVGNHRYEVGTSDFLNAFFSTVVVRLEGGRWGSKYPLLMNKLYMGEVSASDAVQLKSELEDIRKRLQQFTPDLAVWDFEDPSKNPPWGSNISSHIRSLAEYFWTSDGQDLLNVLIDASERAATSRERIIVA